MARRTAIDNPEQLREQVEAYFQHCEDSKQDITLRSGERKEYGERPTVIGLCLWLDIDKATYYRYLSDDGRAQIEPDAYKQIRDILSRARDRCEAALLTSALSGQCDTRIAHLLLGSVYGYAAKTENVVDATVRVEGSSDAVRDWSR